MFSLNTVCTVCKVAFTTSDAIYSTSCGHIFHFSCMNQWKISYSRCPKCRQYNPTSHIIYLDFEESFKNLSEKLVSSQAELKKLQVDSSAKRKKIDEIKRLYNVSEQWRAELQDKVYKLSTEKVENEKHAREMELKSNEIQSLKAHVELLEKSEGVQGLYEKINEFSITNGKLKRDLKDSEATCESLNKKTLMLELRSICLELEMQISKNLQQKSK